MPIMTDSLHSTQYYRSRQHPAIDRLSRSLLSLLLVAALASVAIPAPADDEAEAVLWLNTFMKRWDNWQAEFTQQRSGDDGTVLDSSRGSIALRHPDQFRWEAHEPYRQLIVADGKQVWTYDPDLQQAVVKSLDTALKDTPAAMLLRVDWPAENYVVRFAEGDTPEARRLRFSPRQTETADSFVLVTGEDRPLAIEWKDVLGGHTRVEFINVRPLSSSDADGLFHFEPPPDTDVLEQ